MHRALSITLGVAIIICIGLALTAPVRAVNPICDIVGPSEGGPDQLLVFDASGSYDSDGTIVSYIWSYPGGVVQNSGSWRQRYDGRYFPCYNEDTASPRINPAAWDCGGSCPDNDWYWEGNADLDTAWAIEIVPQDLPPDDPGYPADCQLTSANCAWHVEDTDCDGCKYKYRTGVPAAPSGATVLQRVRFVDSPGDNNALIARLGTGAYRVELYATNDDGDPAGQAMEVHNYRVQGSDPEYFGSGTFNKGEWHIFRVTCNSSGVFYVYVDENTTPIGGPFTAQGPSTDDAYQFGAANSGNTAVFDIDWYTYSIDGAYPPGQGPGLPWMLYVSYPTDGSYEVCVILTDDEALTATCCQTVDIGNHPPVCAISYDLTNPAPGQIITFNANASDPDGHAIASYSWDFGDTGSASGDPATHAYAADGTYTVTCTVTDEFGATGGCSTDVVVENVPPTCSITYAPADPVLGETVTFNANATDPNGDETVASWAWDFGDGGSGSGDPATHSYASADDFTVTCTVTDTGGASDSCTTTVSINTPPTCAIEVTSGAPYRTCYPICFSGAGSSDPDGTVVSYLWSFGDGAPAAIPVPNGTFDDESAWTRYGEAEGEGGISTTFAYCTFNANPTGNFFGRASDGEAIQDHIYQSLSGVAPYGLYRAQATIGTYSNVDPNLVTCRIGVDPNGGTDPAAGSVVWGEGRNNGCPPSPVTMNLDFQAGCGTTVTLFLEFEGPPGNGWNIAAMDNAAIVGATTISGAEVCHAYQAAGTYTVSLTVTDDLGATSTCTTQVEVAAGVCCSVEVSPSDAHICETVNFSATATGGTAPYTYAWDFGDGGTDSGQAVTHVYNTPGTYVAQCVATDNAGTSGLCCATVQVAGALPVCVIDGPTQVGVGTVACWNGYQSYDPDDCGGCGASCPGVGIASYAWDFGGGGANLALNADFEGLYTGGVAESWSTQEVAGSGIFWGDWTTYPYGPINEVGPHGGSNCQFAQFAGGGAADIRLYQAVSGLTIGEVYSVGGWIAMDDPGVSDTEVQVGYDPAGGTNFTWLPAAASDGYWHQIVGNVTATGSSLTIAYRWHSTAVPDAGYYYGYADDAMVAGVASDPTGCHTYDTLGPATVSLTVTDDEGDSSTCSLEITVVDTPLPTCSITYSPSDPSVLDLITFNGNASPSPGGTSIVSYAWSFGDGWGASSDPVTHQYAANGTYTVTLNVTDDVGAVGYCSAKVTVVNLAPTCQISGPSSGAPGEEICFDGSASSDADGTIVSYVWDFGGGGAPPDLTVTNPGFDNDTPPSYPGWTVYGSSSGEATFSYCSYAAQSAPYFFGAASSYGNASRHAYQALSGAVVGATYTASVWINSVSFDPGTPDVPYPTNMHTRIGIDPEGGTDPAAGTVVWSDDTSNMICGPGPYEEKTVEFTATTTTPTVFVEGWNDAAHGWQIFALDDVSVTGVGTTAGVGPTPCHIYGSEGSYTVTLTVTDDDGASTSCTHVIDIYTTPPTVEVTIPLSHGWHMMSLPLEPVNKTILIDRTSKLVDPDSIFYTAYAQGNDPRNRLFRVEPCVGYWVYNPDLYPTESWYEIDVDPPAGKPHPGPWWQGYWFYVEPGDGVTVTYTAYPLPATEMVRFLDINKNYAPGSFDWCWIMTGACARVADPYDPDVTTWPGTSMVTDMGWGNSCTTEPPTVWYPTSDCAGPDAWDIGKIGLPVVGYTSGVGYYTVSPPSGQPYCGAPADTQYLTPGEGYWLDVEDPCVWLRLLADQWP